MVVSEESGLKESDIKGCDKLKYQVSKSSPLTMAPKKYRKKERKSNKMQVILDTLEHVNVTCPLLLLFNITMSI